MTMKVRVLSAAVVLAGAMWMSACGHYVCSTTFGASSCGSSGGGLSQGGGNGSSQTAFIYFMNNNGQQGELGLEGVNVASSGTFAPVPGFVSPTFTGASGEGSGIAIVGKKYLYLPFTGGELFGYSIDASSGALAPLANTPYTVSGGTSIVADPKGRFVFVGDSSGVSTFIVNADGTLGPNAQSPFSTGGITPVTMTTDGLGRFLYVADGADVIAYTYDQTAATLTPVGGSLASATFPFPMIQVVGESTGNYLVGITGLTGATDNQVHVFSITQPGSVTAGALAEAANSPFMSTYAPVFVVTSPSGGFVYTFNETQSQTGTVIAPMEGFTLSNGVLTELPTVSPFPTLLGLEGAFDQSGIYLFMIGQEPNSTITGTVPLTLDSTSGNLGTPFPYAGTPSFIIGVTDEP
ncbi:MAG TPA: hypothetical protein VKQ11_12965 [Candidatus Sulfotelmatobacter sp.]|nr:hypothetical protein [Candidatus Sulfotelmatobacter sp.]